MQIAAPAKINLHLRVAKPAQDGFHPLLSWMTTVSLFDNLELSINTAPHQVELVCDDPSIPLDQSNLIIKVAQAMLDEAKGDFGIGDIGIKAALQKRIPVGAGLGGGSSDGAHTLIALNQLLNLNWSNDRMSELAARFGSDLSFFFFGSSSICTGRGQFVKPIASPKPKWAVLLMPGIHMPTPAVYRKYDEMNLGESDVSSIQPDWLAWAKLDAMELLSLLINDLEVPAFAINNELSRLHQQAAKSLGRIVRMSGSGSTLFTLFDSQAEAHDAVERLLSAQLGASVKCLAVELCPGSRAGS